MEHGPACRIHRCFGELWSGFISPSPYIPLHGDVFLVAPFGKQFFFSSSENRYRSSFPAFNLVKRGLGDIDISPFDKSWHMNGKGT